MHWTTFYTETDIAKILSALNDKENKFIKLWEVVIATNQITIVRPANWPEYFEKFVLPSLSRSIAPKIKSWLAELEKKPPTIEQIQAKIDYLQSEEDKFNLAMKEFTPEEREERLKQIQAEKDRIFKK
jgi:hypothetical protein